MPQEFETQARLATPVEEAKLKSLTSSLVDLVNQSDLPPTMSMNAVMRVVAAGFVSYADFAQDKGMIPDELYPDRESFLNHMYAWFGESLRQMIHVIEKPGEYVPPGIRPDA